MNQDRQLAAIMFTGIVGYSVLMDLYSCRIIG